MGKIKFTKTELKHQQDAKKQFERFLPTLQLKKQQLQLEVRQSADALEKNLRAQEKLKADLEATMAFFSDSDIVDLLEETLSVDHVEKGEANIAGINIPTFQKVVFAESKVDYFATEWFFDDALEVMRQAIALREEYNVIAVQHQLLSDELNTTSQRVNLFEKVKIPECRENIRRIGIMLGDAQTAAVARSKIAKKKSASAIA